MVRCRWRLWVRSWWLPASGAEVPEQAEQLVAEIQSDLGKRAKTTPIFAIPLTEQNLERIDRFQEQERMRSARTSGLSALEPYLEPGVKFLSALYRGKIKETIMVRGVKATVGRYILLVSRDHRLLLTTAVMVIPAAGPLLDKALSSGVLGFSTAQELVDAFLTPRSRSTLERALQTFNREVPIHNPGTHMLPPAPPHPRVTLEFVLAIAKRDGFDVTYSRDSRDGRIPRDSAVVVSRFIRGRGTEQIAHYRAATSGYEQRPEHVELSFQRGYFLNRFHPSDWGFSLNGRIREGAEGSPMDDLSTRWAAFYGGHGGRELIEAQDAFQREQEEHAEQTARAMHEPMVALRARQETGEVGGIKVSRSTGRVRAPRQPREPTPAPVQTPAERLIHALRAREGSVIDRGVRVIGPNRFKSYFDALRGAWAELGGEPADLEAEMRRGEIEVLTEEAGLGSRAGRGVGGNRHATLIEYVIHPDLRLTPTRTNGSPYPAIRTAWALLRRMAPRELRPWPHLRVTPEPGRASARAHAWCTTPRGGRCTVEVAPKLEDRAFKSICGVLAHELGHAYLLQSGAEEHSERDADDAAELLFGHVIRYDADEVQTWGSGRSPRPAHLPQ